MGNRALGKNIFKMVKLNASKISKILYFLVPANPGLLHFPFLRQISSTFKRYKLCHHNWLDRNKALTQSLD